MKRNFYKICFVAFFALSMFSATATADEFVHGLLSETLDNLEKVSAANPWLSPDIQVQIEEARQALRLSTPAELDGLPPDFYNRLMLLEMSTRQLALLYDPAVQMQSMQAQGENMKRLPTREFTTQAYQDYVAGALDAPAYPYINWSFGWDSVEMPALWDSSFWSGAAESGVCSAPGYEVGGRFATLSVATALEAAKDIASRFCSQSALGANASLACVVTDVATNIAKGINTFQETCNAYMTAAEVSAIWGGLKTVHGNVQHVYDDLAAHDSDIKGLLEQVLRGQARMQGDLQTVIRLLNTPSGIRPDWPVKR